MGPLIRRSRKWIERASVGRGSFLYQTAATVASNAPVGDRDVVSLGSRPVHISKTVGTRATYLERTAPRRRIRSNFTRGGGAVRGDSTIDFSSLSSAPLLDGSAQTNREKIRQYACNNCTEGQPQASEQQGLCSTLESSPDRVTSGGRRVFDVPEMGIPVQPSERVNDLISFRAGDHWHPREDQDRSH